MKKLVIFSVIAILLNFTACSKKEGFIAGPSDNNPSPVVTGSGWDVKMKAGDDIKIKLPVSETGLSGSYLRMNNSTAPFFTTWKKISGPSTPDIINPGSLLTILRNLEKGVYAFELSGSGSSLRIQSDTVLVTVEEPDPIGTREIILPNLSWSDPWYRAIEILEFYSIAADLSPGTPFHLFIQREPWSVWIPVEPITTGNQHMQYAFHYQESRHDFYKQRALYIHNFSSDQRYDRPTVKILY